MDAGLRFCLAIRFKATGNEPGPLGRQTMTRVQLHRFVDLSKKSITPKPNLDRRGFLTAAAGLAATTAMAPEAFARNFGPGVEPTRYPDPDVVVLDKRFKYKLGNTPIQRLHTGTLWAEGPAWNAVGRYLVWS